jgi:hypothetical protein
VSIEDVTENFRQVRGSDRTCATDKHIEILTKPDDATGRANELADQVEELPQMNTN